MIGLRIECHLSRGTNSLSVVLPALSDRRAGMRGAHQVGWFCRLPGNTYVWPWPIGDPPRPATAAPRALC